MGRQPSNIEGQIAPGGCIVCGGEPGPWLAGLEDYITGERFDIARCPDCGLGVTQPAPPASELKKYYPARYRGDRHAGTGSFRTRRRAAALSKNFPRGFRGRLLDLGAGAGEFALYMRSQGWEVSATEIEPSTVELLRSNGIDARPSSDGSAGWDKPFDAITAWHVVEHVNDPAGLLEDAGRILKPGGLLQVTVPNLESWQARLGGRHWFHLDVPRHLFHFTPRAIGQLLERHGFEVLATGSFAIEYDWFGAIQTPLNAMLRRQNVLFEALTKVNRRFSGALVASGVLGPMIGAATLVPTVAAGLVGAGATLSVTCRPRK